MPPDADVDSTPRRTTKPREQAAVLRPAVGDEFDDPPSVIVQPRGAGRRLRKADLDRSVESDKGIDAHEKM